MVLSGVMMLEHLGWQEAADLIVKGLDATIGQKIMTYDFARLTEGAKEVKCSGLPPPSSSGCAARRRPLACKPACLPPMSSSSVAGSPDYYRALRRALAPHQQW